MCSNEYRDIEIGRDGGGVPEDFPDRWMDARVVDEVLVGLKGAPENVVSTQPYLTGKATAVSARTLFTASSEKSCRAARTRFEALEDSALGSSIPEILVETLKSALGFSFRCMRGSDRKASILPMIIVQGLCSLTGIVAGLMIC